MQAIYYNLPLAGLANGIILPMKTCRRARSNLQKNSSASGWIDNGRSISPSACRPNFAILLIPATPLHAQAVPDADPTMLKDPADAARELVGAIERALLELRSAAQPHARDATRPEAVAEQCR